MEYSVILFTDSKTLNELFLSFLYFPTRFGWFHRKMHCAPIVSELVRTSEVLDCVQLHRRRKWWSFYQVQYIGWLWIEGKPLYFGYASLHTTTCSRHSILPPLVKDLEGTSYLSIPDAQWRELLTSACQTTNYSFQTPHIRWNSCHCANLLAL